MLKLGYMKHSFINNRGFTIVELLIVVVVIGILGAITIVSYTGIQNRAHDTAVESDIANLVKIIHIYEVDNGQFPTAGSKLAQPNSTLFTGINFKPSKSSYNTSTDNLFYCKGTVSGADTFNISLRSKSGAFYLYKSNGGLSKTSTGNIYSGCMNGFDGTTAGYSYGYYMATNSWYSWTN